MATEFSHPFNSNTLDSLLDKMQHTFFTAGTIKSEMKEEPSIDLDDSEFERAMLEQVPSFDQYLMNNITYSPYNSCEFSIAPSSLLSSDSLSLSSIASSTSSASSSSSLAPSSPPPLLIRPQSLSLACFDIKKHDTISSYLENIDLDIDSR